jgi:hypothetical protein
VSRPVAPTEFDSSDKRRTWAVAQLVRLVRLVGRRCHDAARPVRLADCRKSARLVDSSDSSDFVGRRCHDAARLVRLADGRKSARLVDSSDCSDSVGTRQKVLGVCKGARRVWLQSSDSRQFLDSLIAPDELYKTVQVWGGGSPTLAVHMYPNARLCG